MQQADSVAVHHLKHAGCMQADGAGQSHAHAVSGELSSHPQHCYNLLTSPATHLINGIGAHHGLQAAKAAAAAAEADSTTGAGSRAVAVSGSALQACGTPSTPSQSNQEGLLKAGRLSNGPSRRCSPVKGVKKTISPRQKLVAAPKGMGIGLGFRSSRRALALQNE